ncbi:MAG: phosphoribosylformylglycinamidine synthase subunit PurQ [Thermoleophilia bacterium]
MGTSRKRARFGVVVFPGSNCDEDTRHALSTFADADVEFLWHKDTDLRNVDAIVLPGGFSYGDYLRCGAIARFSPIMQSITDFATRGGLVLGICNGFQILTEAGLLPGALLRNTGLKFVCRYVNLRVEATDGAFTRAYEDGQVLRIVVKHNDGNYTVDPATLASMQTNGQVLMRYVDASGGCTPDANPNGALDDIAGVCNAAGNVFGLMPHPENSVESTLAGGADGRGIFQSMIDTILERRAAS